MFTLTNKKVHLLTSRNCHCTEGGQHSINAADERTAAQDQKPVRISPYWSYLGRYYYV